MISENKYFLADVKYHNTDYLLCPYCDIRYHLIEQALAGQKPSNKEELFNFHYFSLRNMVKRIFGITKRRFQILETLSEFTMFIQIKLVFAITGLHNFIRFYQTTDDIYNKGQLDAEKMVMHLAKEERQVAKKVTQISANISKDDSIRINYFKDEIAGTMQ